MVANKKVITSQEIGKLFGLNSHFYQETLAYLKDKIDSQKNLYNEKYSKWKSLFHKFYGDDTSPELFLKHTYFACLLKLFVESKLTDYNNNSIPEFSIYEWTKLNSNLVNEFESIVSNSLLKREDLFQIIYQQIFLLLTRHKIGEFYTFPNLTKKMVDNFYIFGSKILDPTCGSGTFLVQIITTILNSQKKNESKIRAITNVFGFDVNPLAVLATKVNIALLIVDIIDSSPIKAINAMIYLIDSLFPVDFNFNNFFDLKKHASSFDLVIGNPPWLT
ncbi:MAG: N-6 DNA methylase, partial [Candidatus Lokiarchaeota archaeon]